MSTNTKLILRYAFNHLSSLLCFGDAPAAVWFGLLRGFTPAALARGISLVIFFRSLRRLILHASEQATWFPIGSNSLPQIIHVLYLSPFVIGYAPIIIENPTDSISP